MKVFVMITAASSKEYTELALKSFFDRTILDEVDEFYLIDNDRCFASAQLRQLSSVKLIRNDTPLSFAKNVNKIVQVALQKDADLFILHNDLIFSDGWIEPLLYERNAILSSVSNGEFNYESANFITQPLMKISDYVGKEGSFDRMVLAHKKHCNGYMKTLNVPFFCVRIPAAILKRLGFLDTKCAQEGTQDADYCLRAIVAGYESDYALQSFVLHFGNKSQAQIAPAATELSKKWGAELATLALPKESEESSESDSLDPLLSGKRFKELLSKLGPKSLPGLHVGEA